MTVPVTSLESECRPLSARRPLQGRGCRTTRSAEGGQHESARPPRRYRSPPATPRTPWPWGRPRSSRWTGDGAALCTTAFRPPSSRNLRPESNTVRTSKAKPAKKNSATAGAYAGTQGSPRGLHPVVRQSSTLRGNPSRRRQRRATRSPSRPHQEAAAPVTHEAGQRRHGAEPQQRTPWADGAPSTRLPRRRPPTRPTTCGRPRPRRSRGADKRNGGRR